MSTTYSDHKDGIMRERAERESGMATCFTLKQESELRVEVGLDSELSLQLLHGTAEIFGSELSPGRWLTFPSSHKLAVFTWTGATIEVHGSSEAIYIANETPMRSYWDVHSMLEKKRAKAEEVAYSTVKDLREGPKVIVVGPMDSGKSSLSKMLLGWATKQGRKPLFVDLDLGQGSLSIPGTLAATLVDEPVDPVDGIALEAPLVYFYGHSTAIVNPDLYKSLVKELAKASAIQLERNPEIRTSGLVINTMGWIKDLGYELLLHAVESFNADVILVLGEEELYNDLKDEFGSRVGMNVLYLSSSEGVVARNRKLRQQTRTSKTREYFYGLYSTLSPQQGSVRFREVCIYQLGNPRDPTHPVSVEISRDLVHSVLAISYAKEPGELLSSIVAGFIYVSDVDFTSKRLWYVAPCPGPLPNNLLLKGSLLWQD